MKAMNEHLDAKISASQLAVTLIVVRLSVLLFMPSLSGMYSAREYALSSALSFLLCLPFIFAARRAKDHDHLPTLYRWFASAYLILCAAAGVAWLYAYLLSVTDNTISAFVFGAIMICTALYALYCGPEAVVRISLLIFIVFLAICALKAITLSGQMAVSNLGTSQTFLPGTVNLVTVINTFAHPELALFMLLRGNVSDKEKLAGAASHYVAWSFAIQCGFYFLLELTYHNAIFAREYPASLLLGNVLCTALFLAVTAVRLYAFTVGATIGLKDKIGRTGASATVFIAAAILMAILMYARRDMSIALSLLILLGALVYLFTILILTVGGKHETKKNSGNPAVRPAD